QQRLQLFKLDLRRIESLEMGSVLVLGDDRVKRTVGVIGRALQAYRYVGILRDPVHDSLADAGLADTRFPAQENNLTLAAFGLPPQPFEVVHFILAADEPRQPGRANRRETPSPPPLSAPPPRRHWIRKSFEFQR